jgi:hypothetical protein
VVSARLAGLLLRPRAGVLHNPSPGGAKRFSGAREVRTQQVVASLVRSEFYAAGILIAPRSGYSCLKNRTDSSGFFHGGRGGTTLIRWRGRERKGEVDRGCAMRWGRGKRSPLERSGPCGPTEPGRIDLMRNLVAGLNGASRLPVAPPGRRACRRDACRCRSGGGSFFASRRGQVLRAGRTAHGPKSGWPSLVIRHVLSVPFGTTGDGRIDRNPNRCPLGWRMSTLPQALPVAASWCTCCRNEAR